MDKARKTEIVDEYVREMLEKIQQDYDGEIQMVSDSHYTSGHIFIRIKE